MNTADPAASGRYLTLDAMRGAAALAVATYHFDHAMMPHGYAAVDFFFALSGFVIANAYGARLGRGMGIMEFLEIRLVRLYPVYLVGLLVGFAFEAQKLLRGSEYRLSTSDLWLGLGFGALMLPVPGADALFPLNAPYWSLFFEAVVNIVFALVLVRLGRGRLVAVVVAAGLGLTMMIGPPDFGNQGFAWNGAAAGLLRTVYAFGLGMLVARWAAPRTHPRSWLAVAATAALVAMLALPLADQRRTLADLVLMLAAAPAALLAGAAFEPPAILRRAAAVLGDISYPLYAIHYPIGLALAAASRHAGIPPSLGLAIDLVVIAVAAALIAHLWDAPVRRAITRRLKLRRSAPPQTL